MKRGKSYLDIAFVFILTAQILCLKFYPEPPQISHLFITSFFGELDYNQEQIFERESDIESSFQMEERQEPYQKKNDTQFMIDGKPYEYRGPFILYCLGNEQELIRQDHCSSKKTCLKMIQQYAKCPGIVNYQEITLQVE